MAIMFLPALYKKTLLSHFLSVLPWSQPPLDYRNFLISSDCGADHKGPWHLLPVFCWWCQQTFDGDLSTKGIQGEAWSKLYLRSSVPLMLLQCRWAAVRKLVWGLCSYNVYCDYWKEIGKKKKMCPLQYSTACHLQHGCQTLASFEDKNNSQDVL